MVINGLDLVDFGQQLGIGSLRAECGSQKDEGKGYRGFLDHGRFVLRACASKGKPQRTTLQSVLSTARQSCNKKKHITTEARRHGENQNSDQSKPQYREHTELRKMRRAEGKTECGD